MKKFVFVVKSVCYYAGEVNVKADVFSELAKARKFFNEECEAVIKNCDWSDWHANQPIKNENRFIYGNVEDFILIEIGGEEIK